MCSLTIVRVRYHCNGNVIMKEVRRGYSNTVQLNTTQSAGVAGSLLSRSMLYFNGERKSVWM